MNLASLSNRCHEIMCCSPLLQISDAYRLIFLQAIQQLQPKTPHAQSTANTVPLAVFLVGAALDIFQALVVDLDTEGRYLFLNAVANQLRYPNTHTHYFSFILLYLFAESNQVGNAILSTVFHIIWSDLNFRTDVEYGGIRNL